MIYNNSDPSAILAMERGRTGNYGEEYYDDYYDDEDSEHEVFCGMCSRNIADTSSDWVYCYGKHDCLCEDCFKDVIFEDLADECRTPLDEWED